MENNSPSDWKPRHFSSFPVPINNRCTSLNFFDALRWGFPAPAIHMLGKPLSRLTLQGVL